MAKLRFVYAPMSSGKSLRLLSLAHDFSEKNISFMLLKPSADTRDGENVVKSRIGVEMKCIPVGTNDNIFDLVKDNYRLRMATFTKPIQWILVDECQFLTEAQIDQLSDVVDFMDVEVICYGLRTDFKSKLFPASKRLFELADELEEIKSYCDCGNNHPVLYLPGHDPAGLYGDVFDAPFWNYAQYEHTGHGFHRGQSGAGCGSGFKPGWRE